MPPTSDIAASPPRCRARARPSRAASSRTPAATRGRFAPRRFPPAPVRDARSPDRRLAAVVWCRSGSTSASRMRNAGSPLICIRYPPSTAVLLTTGVPPLASRASMTLADRLDALRGARAGHRGAQRDDRAICDDEIRRRPLGRGRIGVRSGRLCRRRRGREQQEPRRQRAGTPARTRRPTDRTAPPAPLVHADRTSGRQPTVRHDDTATSTAASGSHHAGRL